jgi:hypothetical protein
MLPEDHPVETILEGIEAEMGSHPKVILFDIGGVVVSDAECGTSALPLLSTPRPSCFY